MVDLGTVAAVISAIGAFSGTGSSSGGDSTAGGGGMDIGRTKSSGSSGFVDIMKSGLGAYNKMRGKDAKPFSTQESRPSISSKGSNYYDKIVGGGQRSNTNMQPTVYQPVHQRMETVIRNLHEKATNDQIRQLFAENMQVVQPNKTVGAIKTATGPSTLGALKSGA